MAKDDKHGGVRGAMDKMKDTVGGMVGMASASTTNSAGSFVSNAAIGNLYEVEAGRIAMQRGRSEAVRQFATMMMDDHTTATHQMMSALRTSEVQSIRDAVQLPTELDTRRASMIEHLRRATDDDFDKRYLDQQQLAHQETSILLRGYGESGDNPQLRSVARSALPMVERHLAAVRRIANDA